MQMLSGVSSLQRISASRAARDLAQRRPSRLKRAIAVVIVGCGMINLGMI